MNHPVCSAARVRIECSHQPDIIGVHHNSYFTELHNDWVVGSDDIYTR